ncbi:hypothetical protein UFOVP822_6 [uncultured Caudovirales phage]|uniref:Uncharacterized protein n=1 Tax=uncultured Caudovirales phage TaxID=2100421 RepID=A0A6J5P7J2_9CAUD|nr:hypothetical protein UFOVP822_6 [uncultured Caudovirales phage]
MAKKAPQSAPASVPTSDSSTDKARIQAPAPAPAAATQYRCTIRDNPTLTIPAANADEAGQKYLLILGITATENPITVVALT